MIGPFIFNDVWEKPQTHYKSIATINFEKNKLPKKYWNALHSIENGKRFDGYVIEEKEEGKPSNYFLYPPKFENIVLIINALGATVRLIDSEPEDNIQKKHFTVSLSKSEEAELNRLKALFK